MGDQRVPAIDGLEQHEIGHVRHASGARLAQPRRKRLRALSQHADQLGHQICQNDGRGYPQAGRDEPVIQLHAPVRLDLDDPGQPQARIAREFFRLEQVPEPQSPNAEFRGHRTV